MVILGAAVKTLGFTIIQIEDAIKTIFGRKGEAIVEANIKALKAGFEAAK